MSAEKTMALLEALSEHPHTGVTKLASIIGSNKSTVFRFLSTLVELGYVEKNSETEKYALSLKLFRIGVQQLNRMSVHEYALPVMKRLSETTQETIHLVIIEGTEIFYGEKIDSRQSLKVSMSSAQGRFISPIHSAAGKTILAFLDEQTREKILTSSDWTPMTAHSITSRDQLLKELDSVRERGYALDLEENEIGVHCVAAPVFNANNHIQAAVSISGPSVRMTEERIHSELISLIRSEADSISQSIGSHQPQS